MTNPIEELESLFAQTTQGEWETNGTFIYREEPSVVIAYCEDERAVNDHKFNTRHAAVMHNVMPALLELLKCTAKAEAVINGRELGSMDTLLTLIKHKHNMVVNALRKELKK